MVKLIPMSEITFETYLKNAIEDYAEDKVAAGNWTASEALKKSEESYKKLLPEGVHSKNQHLFSILDAQGETVGMIWFATQVEGISSTTAFIYDFSIHEAFRRKGLGKQALLAVEEKAKALNINTLALHVFGHNTAAQHLYEQVGYEITNINMAKKLN